MEENNCDCFICKNEHPFELSENLINSFINGDAVIFAGAGVSTESKTVLKFTLYDDIIVELNKNDNKISFPELMEEYCKLPNGRLKLLNKIKKRFQFINSFNDLNFLATRFHKELATFYPLKTIITTNWDNYFEEYCNATPFVTDDDLSFWESSDRKVLKIHGSINNYGSIIASSSDYKRREKTLNKGVLGSVLKTILATKTIVFIGYSLSDPDFISIYKFVLKQMQGLHKQSYIVTPFDDGKEHYQKLGLIPIVTDGTFFINQLKKHAIESDILLSDDIYTNASYLSELINIQHKELSKKIRPNKHPQVIYALSYQDGMIHALERALKLRTSGEYSHRCNLLGIVDIYKKMQKDKLREKNYEDVAYIEGYINSLIFMALDDINYIADIPKYFAFGVKDNLTSLRKYKRTLSKLPTLHKASFKRAYKFIKSNNFSKDIFFHHPPWL